MKQHRKQYNNYTSMDIIDNHIKLMWMMIFTMGILLVIVVTVIVINCYCAIVNCA